MTRDIMKDFGVKATYQSSGNAFHIEPQRYKGTDYIVEGDYSSASYLIAAAAALNSELTIKNLKDKSKQG